MDHPSYISAIPHQSGALQQSLPSDERVPWLVPLTPLSINSHAHTILQGTFFNSGSGNPADDVQGLLFFDHDVSSPQGVLNVIGLMYWQGQFFGGVGLGTINEGQKVIAQLSWDQPNHQFVASWTDVLTSTKSEALMPYNMPDTALAATPDKLIGYQDVGAELPWHSNVGHRHGHDIR